MDKRNNLPCLHTADEVLELSRWCLGMENEEQQGSAKVYLPR